MDQLSFGLPIREYLLVGLVSAVVTLLLTGPVRMLALKAGAVAWPRGRDVHVTPTPRWGGLAMFGGVLAGLVLALQLPALRLAYFEGSTEVFGTVIATALMVGVGMLDDRYDLDAVTKFAAQVTAGGLLVLYGVQWAVLWIPLGGGGTGISGSWLILGQSQAVLMTVLVTVALVNAMNFVDGLDGLAAGIGMITALATTVFCIGLLHENGNDTSAYSPALIAVVLAGACLGFLPHNFNPARIFMGDTGSMLVGVMLSAATTSASTRITFGAGPGDILALVAPVIVLVGIVFIPLLDLLLAVVRRTRAGTSPFSPDKMHLHHRLLQVGHSHRRAVLLVYLWVAVLAFGAVALALLPQTGLVLTVMVIALGIAFVASTVPHWSRMRTAAAGDGTPGAGARGTGPNPLPAAGDASPANRSGPSAPPPGRAGQDGPPAQGRRGGPPTGRSEPWDVGRRRRPAPERTTADRDAADRRPGSRPAPADPGAGVTRPMRTGETGRPAGPPAAGPPAAGSPAPGPPAAGPPAAGPPAAGPPAAGPPAAPRGGRNTSAAEASRRPDPSTVPPAPSAPSAPPSPPRPDRNGSAAEASEQPTVPTPPQRRPDRGGGAA
ncbi:hypothetical protein [Pseudonocardia phyllosphaerae]|uniref:hypothetical protein n=1 Tax=Pseudonocardia phyllosphaerae TaxID=3390502 RepID=UPI00397DF31B